jgi:UMF1 family MFS transporter
MPASNECSAVSLDRPLPTVAWATYDFANTIYSAIVVTAFFPAFMAKLIGRDIYTGIAQTTSMVLAGVMLPVAGAMADRTGRAKRYLWWFTVLCCATTAGIGLVANDARYDAREGQVAPATVVIAALVLFGLANLTYHASLVFYNSLLPAVASPRRQGRVLGLGVGLGYLGVVIALPVAHAAVKLTGAMATAFLVAGVAFFVSATPCFLFVHPPPPTLHERVNTRVLAERFRELGHTLRSLSSRPRILCFFIGNFLCVDVVNTLIMWTRPYLDNPAKGLGWSPDAAIQVLIGMSATAFVLGLAAGWLTDRLGPKRTMLGAAASVMICIVTASAFRQRAVIIPVILVLGSGGLAGTWVAGRKFLLDIAPDGKVGEFFGLYGLTTKLSVFGCTLFAAVGDWTGTYRIALLAQLVPLLVGMAFLSLARAAPAAAPATRRRRMR